MKILRIILIILLIAFVGMQFVPTRRNQSNIVPKTDFLVVNNPSKNVNTILQESCYDCHSNNTDYPWYNKMQPIAWFLEHHIKEGKDELNFNEWDTYSERRKNSKLNAMIHQIEDEEMPLYSYVLMHRDAEISKDERQTLVAYLRILKKNHE
ncbi:MULTISPECIES: heme-binding domain-containing protein [Aequorivita]|uniref:Haem-binding domain-containing protein n=1 Tax=Aequorivita antarctica TaxID=153266 RepID=A0A5C6YVC6_9FLAO|nr:MULTISPECIES: heme-binding domain-containing protein [Aequorivita]TXD71546.1 hypothetical protein ESU54_16110 [Aequorivita antarctica]SRX54837.1 hypothetical protein AEQU1_01855 [Aequorivita sp. CIP111184]SRX75312.1 hypothetical protein AEQU3_02306 [Aequorivita antarctica]